MKKVMTVCILFFTFSTTVQALSWAYSFVVFDGKVYEVLADEVVAEEQVGKVIGNVTTVPHEMTGNYYGNASNDYAIGTNYAAINGVSIEEAIAVEEGGYWVKAVYSHEAMFHYRNIVAHPLAIALFVIGVLVILAVCKKSLHNRANL